MHEIAITLCCLVCVSHGQRTQTLSTSLQSIPFSEGRRPSKTVCSTPGAQSGAQGTQPKGWSTVRCLLNPLKTFAMLLQSIAPSDAFNSLRDVGQYHHFACHNTVMKRFGHRAPAFIMRLDAPREDSCEQLTLRLASSADTLALGAALADSARAGDILLLHGDYGAGKTCLARGFLRHWYSNSEELVTSPSYLIDNVYPDDERRALQPGITVHHMDLWRLPQGKVEDLVDLPTIFAECVSLIEWPDRLGKLRPAEHLDVHIVIESDDASSNQGSSDDEDIPDFDNAPRIATLTAKGMRWQRQLGILAGAPDE